MAHTGFLPFFMRVCSTAGADLLLFVGLLPCYLLLILVSILGVYSEMVTLFSEFLNSSRFLMPSAFILSSFFIYFYRYNSYDYFYWFIFSLKLFNHFLWLSKTGKCPNKLLYEIYFFGFEADQISLLELGQEHHKEWLYHRMVYSIKIILLLFLNWWTFVGSWT